MYKCSLLCPSTLLHGVLIKKEKTNKIFVDGDQSVLLERTLTSVNKKSTELVSWQSLKYSVKHCVDQLNKLRPSSCNKDVIFWDTFEATNRKDVFRGSGVVLVEKMEISWANERMHHT